jgi:hypothetical protein
MAKREPSVSRLRLDAQLAYLDGRVKRARELNKRADVKAAVERALHDLGVAMIAHAATDDRLATLRERVRKAEQRAARYMAAA